MKIKNQLKKYRNIAGYKQEDAAELLHISTRQYRKIEAETPKAVIQFYKLAKYYGTTVDALIEQDNNRENTKRGQSQLTLREPSPQENI